MKKAFSITTVFLFTFLFFSFFSINSVSAQSGASLGCPSVANPNVAGANYGVDTNEYKNYFPACTNIDTQDLGFVIPSLGDLLTFVIRVFFVIAGLAALFYLLLGAFAWITSGGDEEGLKSAREKIQAAVVGMILIVAVLAIIWTLEQVIFKRRICLGLSCPLTLPGLIETTTDYKYCCVCVNKQTGKLGTVINTATYKCNDDGRAGSL